MTDQQQILERIVLFSIDVTQNMLNEYGTVIPFGVRAFANSEDVKMQCFQEEEPEANWQDLILKTVDELKKCVAVEDIAATAVVLAVEAENAKGVGVQIETREDPGLFVYPYEKGSGQWVIGEPDQAPALIAPRVFE